MLAFFRVRMWCLVTAVVLAVGTTTAAFEELRHTGTPHDAACARAVGASHDASKHRVEPAPASGDAQSDHCVACHLARAPRLGAQAASTGAHVQEGVAHRPIASIGAARPTALASLPSRSPPTFVA